MAVRSIIDIDLQGDDKFRRFSELFAKYQDQLAKSRPAWSQVRSEIQVSAQAFDRMSAALMAQTELQRKLSQEQKAAAQQTQASELSWRNIFRNTSGVALRLKEITTEFLRWSGAVAAFSGLLGAGGLFGIERLAGTATTIRQQSLGLGMTPGEVQAFNVDYGQFFNPQQAEQGIFEALHNPAKSWELGALGVSQQAIASQDPFRIMTDVLKRMPQMMQGWSPQTLIPMMQAYGLDQMMSPQSAEAWLKLSPKERQYWLQKAQTDTGRLGIQDQQLAAWQKLYAQLQRAGAQIEAVFIKGLTPLAPEISLLSQNLTKLIAALMGSPTIKKWIDDLAQGLGKFAQFVGTPQFATDVQNFVKGVGDAAAELFQFGDAVLGVVKWIDGILPKTQNQSRVWERAGEGAGLGAFFGSILPGPGTVGGAVLGGGIGAMEGYLEGLPWVKNWMARPENNRYDPNLGMNLPGVKNQAWIGGADVSGLLHNIGFSQGGGRDKFSELFYSLVQQESGGRQFDASGQPLRSSAGAIGLTQLMPSTALSLGVNPFDPLQNLAGGAMYLNQQLDTFKGNIAEALAAYNEGPGAVQQQLRDYGANWLQHAPAETQNYVASILKRMMALQISQGGMGRININNNTGGSAVVSSSQLYAT